VVLNTWIEKYVIYRLNSGTEIKPDRGIDETGNALISDPS
jgi:hypothetical protein